MVVKADMEATIDLKTGERRTWAETSRRVNGVALASDRPRPRPGRPGRGVDAELRSPLRTLVRDPGCRARDERSQLPARRRGAAVHLQRLRGEGAPRRCHVPGGRGPAPCERPVARDHRLGRGRTRTVPDDLLAYDVSGRDGSRVHSPRRPRTIWPRPSTRAARRDCRKGSDAHPPQTSPPTCTT